MSYQVDLADLLKKILRGHGLSFIYFENEYRLSDDAPPIAHTPLSQNAVCKTVDEAIETQLNTFTSSLFNEAYAVLKNDIRGLLSDSDDRLPVFTDEHGNLQVYTESPTSIPLSTLLLAIDLTVERLASIAQTHNLLDGMAISASWLVRGLKLSIQTNDLSDTTKANARDMARYAMRSGI